MPTICFAPIRGRVARFLKLDECCAKVDDPCGLVTTDGFISVTMTAEVEAGTEILLRNAADGLCIFDPGKTVLKNITAVISLCGVDPSLVAMLSASEAVLNWDGDNVGWRDSTEMNPEGRFSLEMWTDIAGGACAAGGASYGYFLLPCLRDGYISGDVVVQNDAVNLEITAKTTTPSAWGTGPTGGTSGVLWNVVGTGVDGATPGHLLTPIGATDHRHFEITTVPPPAATCGCIATDFTP